MLHIATVLNVIAVAVLGGGLLRYLLLPLIFLAAPFVMALFALRCRQLASFHQATLILNAVALMFGVLVSGGLLLEGLPVDTTSLELLSVAVMLFYVLTPALNIVLVRRVMRRWSKPPRPD